MGYYFSTFIHSANDENYVYVGVNSERSRKAADKFEHSVLEALGVSPLGTSPLEDLQEDKQKLFILLMEFLSSNNKHFKRDLRYERPVYEFSSRYSKQLKKLLSIIKKFKQTQSHFILATKFDLIQ